MPRASRGLSGVVLSAFVAFSTLLLAVRAGDRSLLNDGATVDLKSCSTELECDGIFWVR